MSQSRSERRVKCHIKSTIQQYYPYVFRCCDWWELPHCTGGLSFPTASLIVCHLVSARCTWKELLATACAHVKQILNDCEVLLHTNEASLKRPLPRIPSAAACGLLKFSRGVISHCKRRKGSEEVAAAQVRRVAPRGEYI